METVALLAIIGVSLVVLGVLVVAVLAGTSGRDAHYMREPAARMSTVRRIPRPYDWQADEPPRPYDWQHDDTGGAA